MFYIVSSDQNIELDTQICFAEEIGLSGEIRAVNRIDQRIAEAEKLEYKQIVISKYNNLNSKDFLKLKFQNLVKLKRYLDFSLVKILQNICLKVFFLFSFNKLIIF